MDPVQNIPDPDLAELKEIVKRQGEVIAETNRMVHSMRRGQRWRTLVHVVWWLAIVAVSAASWYYLMPYLNQLLAQYAHLQQQAQQAQTLQQQVAGWLGQFGPHSTTTAQ